MSECLRKGCSKQAAPKDEFCSTRCAKIHYGTEQAPTEAQRREWMNARSRRYRLRQKYGVDAVITGENDHVNRERFEGPTAGKGKAKGRVS